MATLEKTKAILRKEIRSTGPVKAVLRNLPMSARKTRVMADEIREKSVDYALRFLSAQKRACCRPLIKLLESAMSNANDRGLSLDDLKIIDIQVNKGPIRKRFMPRAQGRATKIRKQTAHVSVALS